MSDIARHWRDDADDEYDDADDTDDVYDDADNADDEYDDADDDCDDCGCGGHCQAWEGRFQVYFNSQSYSCSLDLVIWLWFRGFGVLVAQWIW